MRRPAWPLSCLGSPIGPTATKCAYPQHSQQVKQRQVHLQDKQVQVGICPVALHLPNIVKPNKHQELVVQHAARLQQASIPPSLTKITGWATGENRMSELSAMLMQP
eukprot:6210959-Pleurochrysis_carterae.AAC.2